MKNSGLRLDTLPDDLKGALEDNTTFESLDLSSNEIGDKGIEYLMALLGNNQFINCIDLSNNKITDVGAKLLLEFINNNHSLVWIYLAKNKISPTVAADFEKVLNRKTNILVCKITDKNNPEIEEICEIHQQEARSFLKSIRERKFLDDQEIVMIAERFPAIVTLAFLGGHELDVEHTLAAVAYRAFKLGLSLKTSNLRVNFSVDLDDIKDKAQLTRPLGCRHSPLYNFIQAGMLPNILIWLEQHSERLTIEDLLRPEWLRRADKGVNCLKLIVKHRQLAELFQFKHWRGEPLEFQKLTEYLQDKFPDEFATSIGNTKCAALMNQVNSSMRPSNKWVIQTAINSRQTSGRDR
ncbi:MAG: hypothetical protein IPP74_10570 [Alphaproteobacteria bacterium]|nr:hypothetical protein [Alphaproteobacteria bacterium]